ncbi:MAG: class I SAM-dependent methyltransferase [Halorhodospira sp.]
MERTPEPELMDGREQALAYAEADFEEPNSQFVAAFLARFGEPQGRMLDLGCGPGDIPLRFARCAPKAQVTAMDGSPAMIELAERARESDPSVGDRLHLLCSTLQRLELPPASFDAVISNSLLHHLHEPDCFWEAVRRYARPGAAVLVMDLSRPPTPVAAQAIVDTYAAAEPAVLREDFYNSLHAAFTPAEVRTQLDAAGLEALAVETASDRHWIAVGRMPA